jgi:hypothetical protein
VTGRPLLPRIGTIANLMVWSLALLASSVLPGRTLAADILCPWLSCSNDECSETSDCDELVECVRNYGQCGCNPRKTLLQWSYGTSFAGGPPEMDEPLVSDRPDFTEATTTVGRGVVQIEAGYTFTIDRTGNLETVEHSFPELLCRIGILAEWLELRIGYDHGAHDVAFTGTPAHAGTPDSEQIYMGFKIGLTPQEGILPEMVLIPQMSLYFGDDEAIASEVLPGVNWVYGWEINDWLSTAMSTQINRAYEGDGRYFAEFAQSWTFGYELTERLGAFTEWFMFSPVGGIEVEVEHYMDGGFTFHVTDNFQLDIRAGVGLNEAADNFFTGAGSVVRF